MSKFCAAFSSMKWYARYSWDMPEWTGNMGPRQSQCRLWCRAFFAVADLNLELPKTDFYFGLIDKGEPKSCNVKVKVKKTLAENKVLTLTTLTTFDYFWLFLTIFYYFWLFLTTFDYFWLLLKMFEYFLLFLNTFDYFFDNFLLFLTTFDYFLIFLTTFDYCWVFFTIFTIFYYFWLFLTIFDYFWLGRV